jgi:hypothetical protein
MTSVPVKPEFYEQQQQEQSEEQKRTSRIFDACNRLLKQQQICNKGCCDCEGCKTLEEWEALDELSGK